jgi:molybdopterin-binding protein
VNRIKGHISVIASQDSIAIVDVQVGVRRFTATLLAASADLLQWEEGQQIVLCFNEMEVALAKNLQGELSLRNRFPGVVVSIELGKLLTRVVFKMDEHIVRSVITTRSALAMQIQVGDQVEGLVKSNEMNLMRQESP